MRAMLVGLPAFLAPAIVNGDESGMCDCRGEGRGAHSNGCEAAALLARCYEYVRPGRIISVEGEAYFGRADVPGFVGDIADYIVLYPEE